jgi:hypothetical protein
MTSVTTSSVLIAVESALIQNLGDDNLYVSDVNPATVDNGVLIQSGEAVSVLGGDNFYAISAGTSDVRVLGRGAGFFYGAAPS